MAVFRLAAMDSSESIELPLDYLKGHKDGLEWASQLAEANHPETGDWLYDDPIELAKAIRKGPDMPPAQPVADSEPVAWTWQHLKQWYVTNDEERARELAWDGVKVEQLYRHAQPVPVASADLLHTAASAIEDLLEHTDPNTSYYSGVWADVPGKLRAAAPQSPGSEPATVPGKWIPVSERMPEDEQEVLTINRMGHCFVSFFDKHSGLFFDRIDAPAACCIEHVLVTHWMPLPAAPQEVKDAHH
ncbi:TPA: DUF551 domain-containing protein [Klebsiella pneumoniae]|nr:DUF551 domain-containing protein [Klebsiella pneumoniae]